MLGVINRNLYFAFKLYIMKKWKNLQHSWMYVKSVEDYYESSRQLDLNVIKKSLIESDEIA